MAKLNLLYGKPTYWNSFDEKPPNEDINYLVYGEWWDQGGEGNPWRWIKEMRFEADSKGGEWLGDQSDKMGAKAWAELPQYPELPQRR